MCTWHGVFTRYLLHVTGDTQAIRLQQVCELETQLAESIQHHNEEVLPLVMFSPTTF